MLGPVGLCLCLQMVAGGVVAALWIFSQSTGDPHSARSYVTVCGFQSAHEATGHPLLGCRGGMNKRATRFARLGYLSTSAYSLVSHLVATKDRCESVGSGYVLLEASTRESDQTAIAEWCISRRRGRPHALASAEPNQVRR